MTMHYHRPVGQQRDLTVRIKMDVITSGAHDGLLITTGVQTEGASGSGSNSQMLASPADWRRFWGSREQQQQLPAITASHNSLLQQPAVPLHSSRTVVSPQPTSAADELEWASATGPSSSLLTAATMIPASQQKSNRMRGETDGSFDRKQQKETVFSEHVDGTTTAAALEGRQSTALSSPQDDLAYFTAVAGNENLRTSSAAAGSCWGERHFAENYCPESRSIKLNLFENESESCRADLGQLSTQNTNVKNPKKFVVEEQQQFFLNDSTTTTTTLEVFRDRFPSHSTDWYKLPTGPLTLTTEAPDYVSATGPPYERISRATTRFSDGPNASSTPVPPAHDLQQQQKSVQWDERVSTRSWEDSLALPINENSQSAQFNNLQQNSNRWIYNKIEPPRPPTIIVRKQKQERSVQKIVPQEDDTAFTQQGRKANFDRENAPVAPPIPPKTAMPETSRTERICPPRPPPPKSNFPITTALAPPRPTSRKPHQRGARLYQLCSQTLPRKAPTLSTHAKAETTVPMLRSASSSDLSELYKSRQLYQTRDCLGRVVREI